MAKVDAESVVELAPFVLEILGLATKYITVLAKENKTPEDMAELQALFDSSFQSASGALDSLADAHGLNKPPA